MRTPICDRYGYLGTDSRGRLSLQVRAMRALIRERDGYRETDKTGAATFGEGGSRSA